MTTPRAARLLAGLAPMVRHGGVAMALAVLVAWSFWWRCRFLTSSPYPLGIDGYYYAIQVRSVLAQGTLYYPAAPLGFWFMALFAAPTDPITGVKIAAALGSALAVIPMYALGRRAGNSRAAGFVAAVLVATSAESFYVSTEFVKTGLGVTMALFFLWALARALDREPTGASSNASLHASSNAPSGPASRARVVVVAACFVAVVLTHKLAVALAVIGALPVLGVALRASPRRLRLVVILALAALPVVILALGLIMPDRVASPDDLRLLCDIVDLDRHDWSLPALHAPGGPALMFSHEVAKAAVLAMLALAMLAAQRFIPRASAAAPDHALDRPAAHDRALVVGPALLAVVLALPFLDASNPQGLVFRVRLLAFVPMALCAAVLAGAIFVRVAPLWRIAAVLPFAVALVLARPAMPSEGVVFVHPAMHAAVRALAGVVPEDHTIIVPERHIAFMAAWHTRNQVRLRPESVPAAQRWRLIPMALMSPDLAHAVDRAREQPHLIHPLGLHPGHRNGLVVMPEATWQWILGQLPPGPRQHYQRWPTI